MLTKWPDFNWSISSPLLLTNSWLRAYLFRQTISKSSRLKRCKIKQLSCSRRFKSALTCRAGCTCEGLYALDQNLWKSSEPYVSHITLPSSELMMMPFSNLKDAESAIACSRSNIFESLTTSGVTTLVYFQENFAFYSDATINKPLVQSNGDLKSALIKFR